MNYRPFGKTGLSVSEISFGTVSLGVDYGIETPGGFGRPDEQEAIHLLEEALESGINLYDTAPAYGESERLLGLALGAKKDAIFATKITIPPGISSENELKIILESSLESSLEKLRRDYVDILQIHNATVETLAQTPITEVLSAIKKTGRVRCLGATVYTVDEALAVIAAGEYESLQVAFSILDQRMADRVFPAAYSAGIAVMCRSALLKGVLSPKAQWLPEELKFLRERVDELVKLFGISYEDLPSFATRYCLSSSQISTVLTGARTSEELQEALSSALLGVLPEHICSSAGRLSLADEKHWNPSCWPIK
ncbi:aldo/keto reductase [Geobacter pelophilus]|uniref:Aldo/keto reductase n=1 Tax=Geoanaerobacter pelophilus TaxID=60036 RepID=A0AAW4L315_9BACT|nr:aldo/keto reductase [Geoanaerobacter pelophilus]